MPNKKIRIVIVDDHPVVRRGVSETFAEAEGFDVVGEGGSAADAIALARDRRPDLIVLDVNLPGGGAEAVAHIHELRPQAVIMMLSVREDLATVRAALKAGARASSRRASTVTTSSRPRGDCSLGSVTSARN